MCGAANGRESGPFGVEMAATASSYNCTVTDDPLYFTCSTLPKTHPDMDYYVIMAPPETGVCWVKGLSIDVSTNGHGSALKSKVDTISDQIASVYGQGKRYDLLVSGSIWDDSNDWMMGLHQSDRHYYYRWSTDSGAALKADVEEVYVSAKALSGNKGFVAAEFYFENFEECKAAEKARAASAF
jgi:hypothetical protein